MQKLRFIALVLLSIILLDSCASKLPIPIKNKTALFRYRTAEGALNTEISVDSGSDNPLIKIAVGLGSTISSWKAAEKLKNAIDEDELASALSEGLEKSSQQFCSVKMVESEENNPDLIFETEVMEYSLVADEGVAGLEVKCRTKLIERATSKRLWDKEESRFIAFKEPYYSSDPSAIENAIDGALNINEVLSMPDDELAKLMYSAAYDAGEYFGMELEKASEK